MLPMPHKAEILKSSLQTFHSREKQFHPLKNRSLLKDCRDMIARIIAEVLEIEEKVNAGLNHFMKKV